MDHAPHVLRVNIRLLARVVALHALLVNIRTVEAVRAAVLPVLPVSMLQHAAMSVRTVPLVGFLILHVLGAHTVGMELMRLVLVAHLVFHVLLEHTQY